MVKSTSMSSDIDFIKEFEELKLKQRLLVDSLKGRRKTGEERAYVGLQKKLDFLVEIFKEANTPDEAEKEADDNISKILEKVNSLESKYDQLIAKLDIPKEMEHKQDVPGIEKEIEPEAKVDQNDSQEVAPSPEFKVEEGNKSQENEGEKKKKKWFS